MYGLVQGLEVLEVHSWKRSEMSWISRSLCHEYIIWRNKVSDDSAIITKEETLIVECLKNMNSIRINI